MDGLSARNYYEEGCSCVMNGSVSVLPEYVNNWVAVSYYYLNCKCSRSSHKNNEESLIHILHLKDHIDKLLNEYEITDSLIEKIKIKEELSYYE